MRRSAVFAWMPDGVVRDVSATPGRGFYALPSVHPDGGSVVYHGETKGRSKIWRTSLVDGTVTPLTTSALVACSPSYSADGQKIVFGAHEVAQHESWAMDKAVRRLPGMGAYYGGVPYWMHLYVMNSDGTGLRRLTSGRYYDMRPAFSPDARYVVFLRRKASLRGHRMMWRVAVDGQDAPDALIADISVGRPSYSADGASIYFFTKVGSRNRLAVMPGGGGDWKPLVNDSMGAWSHGPFCDPDGEHLWYHCGYRGESIGRLPLSGGEPKVMDPPGFAERSCAHVSASRNRVVTFDWMDLVRNGNGTGAA